MVETPRDDDVVLATPYVLVDGYVIATRAADGMREARERHRQRGEGEDADEPVFVKGRGVVRRASVPRVVSLCLQAASLDRYYRVVDDGRGGVAAYTSHSDADTDAQEARAAAVTGPLSAWAAKAPAAKPRATRRFATWTLLFVHILDEYAVDVLDELGRSPDTFAPAVAGLGEEHFVPTTGEA